MKIQQGDIVIEKIEGIPSKAVEIKKSHTVAEGEGHHEHRLLDEGVFFEFKEKTYLRLTKPTKLAHVVKETLSRGEHVEIELPQGDYEYGHINEYDYFNEMKRKVID